MRDNEPENFRSLLIQKQLDDGADQHQGAADKKQNDERRSVLAEVVYPDKKYDRRQQRKQCPRHDEDGDDGDPAARQRPPPMQAAGVFLFHKRLRCLRFLLRPSRRIFLFFLRIVTEQIVAADAEQAAQARLIEFAGEGHGFSPRADRTCTAYTEEFVEKHI